MKSRFTIFLLLFAINAQAQKITRLNAVSANDTLVTGQAIIYGNFIQRLGFRSGGFEQVIHLVDTATRDEFAIRVKPIFKSARENTFAYHIKPGTYAITKYQYTESKWYGAKEFHEPIRKHNGGYYLITIPSTALVNLGGWHFETHPGGFAEGASETTEKLAKEFNKLDFSKAVAVTPK